MAGFQSPITINAAMDRIKNKEYLLPAFQREYVWEPHQIEELFDSLMRGYPISSMLFWRVKDESKTAWKFYSFLEYFRERYHTHNELFNTQNHKDFYAILDGQQRLTSLYLGLFSHYDVHRSRSRWEHNDKYFHICHLYFNLTQSQEPENPSVKYEFLWLDKDKTNEEIIYIDEFNQKWFQCKGIYTIGDINDIIIFSQDKSFTNDERKRLCDFHTLIFNTKDESKINFYLEEEQKPDKAVNIFIRINSGGTNLGFGDILFGIAVANWKKVDARSEINNLVDNINQNFKIDKDLILRGFLFLFHNNIKFQINSFDKNFIESIEEKWNSIKNCFTETFRLLRSFGLEATTLSSNNAVLPILYFIYHKNLTDKILDSATQKENRELIKKWLLRAIVLKPFGGHGDTILANMRKAFIKDFKQDSNTYFDSDINLFPLEKIEKEARYNQNIDDEYLENNIIYARKNSPEAFAVLSLLYPHLDYKNNNFHIDHLHPESKYKEYEKLGVSKLKFEKYDSLPNLQMLDANENMSKNDKYLDEWVEENCGNNKEEFLARHLIPNVDLSIKHFDEFYKARKKMLKDRLKEILS